MVSDEKEHVFTYHLSLITHHFIKLANEELIYRITRAVYARLGAATDERTVEALVTDLQTSQDDIERTLAVIEEDKNKDTLLERVQKISDFVAGTSSRFLEIERSLRELLRLKDEFGALQTRLVPLDDKETGVNSVLKAINTTRDELAANIDRIDTHEGSTLKAKVEHLGQTNKQLDEQVTGLLAQFSRLDTMHKDICGLFAKLNYAQNVPRGMEQGVRLISSNG